MSDSRLIVSVLCLLGFAVTATGQAEFTHNYPFTGARAVVAEKIGSDPATIYEAAGSGAFVLDGLNLEPVLKSGVANQLRAGGMVHDFHLTGDHLYAAVHRGGITRFSRSSTSPQPDWTTGQSPNVSDAWAINVPARSGDFDLVFVGTNDDYDHNDSATGGKLYMLQADADLQDPAPPDLITSVDLGAPIFSLASRVEGNVVTLLVGTACREPTSGTYASLLRYNFDITNGLPSTFPTPSTWNPTEGSSTVPTFIRDIVIDPVDDVAYAAAYTRGVFKVNVPSGMSGGLSTASGSWPITAGSGNKSYFDSLALHDGSLGKLLVVGMGPTIRSETQEFGTCTFFEACDEQSTGTQRDGMSIYDVSGASPSAVGSLLLDKFWPLAMSTYVKDGALIIATAALQKGLAIVKATPSGGNFTLHVVGGWNGNDSIPTGAFDDILVIENNAFVAFEAGVAAFDITEVLGEPASDLFETPVDVAVNGGVVLAGCAAEMGFPTIVFAANQSAVELYEVSGDGPTADITFRGAFEPGRGIRPYSCGAIPPSLTPDGHPWLISVNSTDVTNPHPACPGATLNYANCSVRIYRVDLDGSGHLDRESVVELGSYAPDPCAVSSGFLVWAYPIVDEDTITVYVGYTPKTVGTLEEPDAGLLALEVDFQENDPGLQDDAVSVTELARVPVFEDAAATESGSGGISYSVSHGTMAVAFGCHGIATFSIGDPAYAPELLEHWPTSGACPTSFMDCASGAGYVYATGLDGRIYVFDPHDMSTGQLDDFDTVDQGAFITPAPSTEEGDPPPPAFFMTGFGSGLHRVQFLSVP